MRKNGVNRELVAIDGGVCAPFGFYANAVSRNFLQDDSSPPDFAFILAKKRYATAYVPTEAANVGAFVSLSQKHVRTGVSSAVLIHSGVACGYGENEDVLAEKVSRLFANALKIDKNEIILVSTGKYGEKLEIAPFEIAAKNISTCDNDNNANSFAAATVLAGKDGARELAYSFQIGDVTCKIGAIFCGDVDGVQPLVCIITTDVNIASETLQKALKAAANEHFYALSGRINTPNDCIFALASGAANNWKITENNSDYQKFSYALCAVAERICKSIAAKTGNGFSCKVVGARSKNAAREIAKSVAASLCVKNSLAKRRLDTQSVVAAVLGGAEKVAMEKLSVAFRSTEMEIITFEENREIPVGKEAEKQFFHGENAKIIVWLNEGNYSANAYGGFTTP